MPRGAMKRKWNPFSSSPDALTSTVAVGAEANNTINVAVQLKDGKGRSLAEATKVTLRFCTDAAGTIPAYPPPSDGVYAGTVGQVVQGTDHLKDGVIVKGALAISGVAAEKFKTTAQATVRVKTVTSTKAATDNLTFTAAHVINANKFGVILIQIDGAGAITTKVPVSPQNYASAALALAALPSPDGGKAALGYIAIAAKGVNWTANTDDMTNGSDVTTATFNDAGEQSGPNTFTVISNATGAFNVNVYEAGAKSFYMVIEFPDGTKKVSPVITFA